MQAGEVQRNLSRAVCSQCKRPCSTVRFQFQRRTPLLCQASFSTTRARRASLDAIPKSSEGKTQETRESKDGKPKTVPEMVEAGELSVLERLRVVPASRAYFSAQPRFTDSLLELRTIQRKFETLPTVSNADAPRIAWKDIIRFKEDFGAASEPVKTSKYAKIQGILKRLNRIHPALMPQEVSDIMRAYKRDIQPHLNRPIPRYVDIQGKATGLGKRKSSSAVAYVVEGEGEILVNGKPISEMFSRVHDRESAVWALKAAQRTDRYNIFAVVKGGGTTGQAGALTLAIAKALVIHEPALKTPLRAAGCITRDPRRVERKKPGKLKARKMPAWVKR